MTFLDFGLVKRYTEDDLAQLLGMAQAVAADDRAAHRVACETAGYYPVGAPFSDDEIWDYSSAFWEMLLIDDAFQCTPEYASDVVRRFFLGRATHGDVVKWANMPARWVILQRINVGLIAILGRLRAEANWRRIAEEIWPFTEGPPSSALGRQEADWWNAKRTRIAAAL